MSREPCVASACGTGQRRSRQFSTPHNLVLPRVRTHHTKKPSRFVHALSARPLKVQGGRECDMHADGVKSIFFILSADGAWILYCRGRRHRRPVSTYIAETNLILLCSHSDPHPKLNREVCHSLTWHSSESESALERFEPVAAAMLWSDGQGTLFARVAARRRKVFKRGIDTYAEHVCRRRRDGSQCFPLFVLFVLFGQAKRTLKEKFLYVSSRETNGLPY